jgi:hypothetical protein
LGSSPLRLVMDLMNASGRNSRIPDLIKAGIEVRIRHVETFVGDYQWHRWTIWKSGLTAYTPKRT